MNYNRQTSRVFSPAPPSQFASTRARRGSGCRCNTIMNFLPHTTASARDDTRPRAPRRKSGSKLRMASRGAERAPLLAGASRAAADDVEGGAQHPAIDPAESSLEGVDDEARDRRDARRRRRAHRWPDDVPQRRERVVDVAVVVVGGLRGAVERGGSRGRRATGTRCEKSRS